MPKSTIIISGKFATSAPQRKLTVGVFGNNDILTYLYNNDVFSFIRINSNEFENNQGKFDYIIKVPENFPENDSILIKVNISGRRVKWNPSSPIINLLSLILLSS